MVGKNLLESKDYNGTYFVKEIIDIAKRKGSGTFECTHMNLATKLIQKKVYYFQRIGDCYISCGVYR